VAQQFRKVWLAYTKRHGERDRTARFGLEALRRLARHDDQIETLLRTVGLLPPAR